MFPVLATVAGVEIQSYGFFIALGYLVALWIVNRLAARDGLPPRAFSDLCFLALLGGLLGARILFVLTNLSYFGAHPEEIPRFWGGGLVFYGGFLFVFPLALAYLRWKKLPLLRSLDVIAPALAFGHSLGRIGCLGAGCCHGSYCPYPWGVRIDTDLVDPALRGLPLHPTQAYESFGLLVIGAGLLALRKRKPPAGTVAGVYVMAYAVLRIIVECFRGDSIRGEIGGVSTSQALAAGLLLAGGGALFLARRIRGNH
jgi:phosphatidylglycerol:prolipoprotein diacylglycerol transferase